MPRQAQDSQNLLKPCELKALILMAIESARTLHEVESLVEEGHYNMINVRLSKCGGFRRSLRIIDFLRGKGVPYQVACQLGESGILSAAGRALGLMQRRPLPRRLLRSVPAQGECDRAERLLRPGRKSRSFGRRRSGRDGESEKLSRLSDFSSFVSLRRAC